ncbi:A/G-specific adenine glycosylase [Methanimicrococcus blatticola]|uniref:Adenine DNA glycosylase n=1 Tax=Methanimicrococcus blatticola TaxID=91560 RepID=A0A484F683_9EURY|nr:A/G-specific adenine glycosylase [Methanimicrococcus blatticola]MBZ3935110.1 A/G-specific adenine glycosylase [Methanimicrococcus blatticola]MCC2508793.1 A/G-specific adenine glycosylase [Methanimicrococcus blatticola]TDQ71174.1 A/G-specific DNA-adenine glycosylase [Methanimicrococcus blatticola]
MKTPSIEKNESAEYAKRAALSSALLDWYDRNGRDLPWRVRGAHPNPYMVWIAEIMLQQTTVKTVIPYFYRFMDKFPDIQSLANADIEDVLLMWQGLGYYTRARKLHECAKYLTDNCGGRFPETYSELLKLPGIGPYTAASISSLAFDKREAVVDGNVIRVISRLYGIQESTAVSLPDIQKKAQELMSEKRAADYTSAIMDLGATVCTPKNPICGDCPFGTDCVARALGLIDEIPKIEKLQKINKSGKLFWIENENGAIFIQKRSEKGLLHGLTEFPWEAAEGSSDQIHKIPFPFQKTDWVDAGKSVKHVFTHINLTLEIYKTQISLEAMTDQEFMSFVKNGQFVLKDNFKDYPFSTLMKKVIKAMEPDDSPNQSQNKQKNQPKKTSGSKRSQKSVSVVVKTLSQFD